MNGFLIQIRNTINEARRPAGQLFSCFLQSTKFPECFTEATWPAGRPGDRLREFMFFWLRIHHPPDPPTSALGEQPDRETQHVCVHGPPPLSSSCLSSMCTCACVSCVLTGAGGGREVGDGRKLAVADAVALSTRYKERRKSERQTSGPCQTSKPRQWSFYAL